MTTILLSIAILLASLWFLRRSRASAQEPDAAALLAQLERMEADFDRAEKEERILDRELRKLTKEANTPATPKPRKPREKTPAKTTASTQSDPKDNGRFASLTHPSPKKRFSLEPFSQMLDQKFAAKITGTQPTLIRLPPTPSLFTKWRPEIVHLQQAPQLPNRYTLFRLAKTCLTIIARPVFFGIRSAHVQKLVLRASFIGWGAWGRIVAKDFVFRRNSSDNPPPATCVSVACENPRRIFSLFFKARPPNTTPPPQNQAA